MVRIEQLYHQVPPSRKLLSSPPIKILVAIPEDPTHRIQADQEIKHIVQKLSPLGEEHVSIVTLSGRFDITEFRRTIDQEEPDILHLVSHGEPNGLLFWKDAKLSLVSTESLRVTLQRTPSVKLVVLNACLAGRVSDQTPFSTVATQILQTDIPAVIALQLEIATDTAIHFTQFLYEELITWSIPGVIDTAVGYARSSLYALDPNGCGYINTRSLVECE